MDRIDRGWMLEQQKEFTAERAADDHHHFQRVPQQQQAAAAAEVLWLRGDREEALARAMHALETTLSVAPPGNTIGSQPSALLRTARLACMDAGAIDERDALEVVEVFVLHEFLCQSIVALLRLAWLQSRPCVTPRV